MPNRDKILIADKPLDECGYLEIHSEIYLVDNQISELLILSDQLKQEISKSYPDKVGNIFNDY